MPSKMAQAVKMLTVAEPSPRFPDEIATVPEPTAEFVDWHVVAIELFDMLTHVVDLPSDIGEWAPLGDNDFQTACYRAALYQLQEDIR